MTGLLDRYSSVRISASGLTSLPFASLEHFRIQLPAQHLLQLDIGCQRRVGMWPPREIERDRNCFALGMRSRRLPGFEDPLFDSTSGQADEPRIGRAQHFEEAHASIGLNENPDADTPFCRGTKHRCRIARLRHVQGHRIRRQRLCSPRRKQPRKHHATQHAAHSPPSACSASPTINALIGAGR